MSAHWPVNRPLSDLKESFATIATEINDLPATSPHGSYSEHDARSLGFATDPNVTVSQRRHTATPMYPAQQSAWPVVVAEVVLAGASESNAVRIRDSDCALVQNTAIIGTGYCSRVGGGASGFPDAATVRRSNRACRFPAHGFHEHSSFRDGEVGIYSTRLTGPSWPKATRSIDEWTFLSPVRLIQSTSLLGRGRESHDTLLLVHVYG